MSVRDPNGQRLALQRHSPYSRCDFPLARDIVRIGRPAGDAVDTLGGKLADLVPDLAGLPAITQAASKAFEQPQPFVDGLQQDSAPIGAAVLLVETGDNRPMEHSGNSRHCVIVASFT